MKYRLNQHYYLYLPITVLFLFLLYPGYAQIKTDITHASCPNAPDGSVVITILNRPLPSEVKCSDGVVVDNVISELIPGIYTATVTDENGCEGSVEFEVKVNEQQFVINFGVSQPNCGAEDGELTATIDWGKPKYQFNWYKDGELYEIDETDNMTSTISEIDEGEYTVEVFDDWGCVTSDSRTVERYNETPIPIDRIETKDLICPGDKDGEAEVFIDPTDTRDDSKFTYEWSNGGDTKRIKGLKGGEYSVTVYDEAECWGEATATVYEPPKLELKIEGDGKFKYCVANHNSSLKATLEAIGSGGTPPLTYPDGKTRTYASAGYHCKTFKVVDSENCETKKKGCVLIIKILCSWDPNEIIGEEGYGEDRWIGLDKKIAYTINYENDPEFAFAAAQTVEIKLPIDQSLDIYSLRLDDFGFGSYRFQVPKNTAHYTKRLDLRDSLGIFVDFVAGIDIAKREAFWRLVSVDPETGMAPKGVDAGFLKINDPATKQGEGFVTFSIQPNPFGKTGDTLLAKASIQFDYNDTIGTNTWINRIDIDPPMSNVGEVESIQYKDSVQIPISYTDVGSGVKEIDLYVSANNEPFRFLANLDNIFDKYYFKGEQGIQYKFFSRATDSVGNKETMKSVPDVSFAIVEKALGMEHNLTHATCYGSEDAKIDLDVSGGIAPYSYSWNNDSTTEDISNLSEGEYIVTVTDKMGIQLTDTFTITQPDPIPVDLGDDITLISGDQIEISAPAGYAAYLWSNESTQSSIIVGSGLDTLSYTYAVKVTDINGCENSDTIIVHVKAPTEVIEISSNTRIEIYPNPSKGMLYLTIQNESEKDIELKINDIAGNLIFSEIYKNKPDYFNEKIDLSAYPDGNYILTISQGQNRMSSTIVVY